MHANWLLNAIGLVVSFCASVVLVRAVEPPLFAQYAAVLAIINLATFVFETGAYSGLTRYFHEASQQGARGTFYRRMQSRRAKALEAARVRGPVLAAAMHPTAALAIAGAWEAVCRRVCAPHRGAVAGSPGEFPCRNQPPALVSRCMGFLVRSRCFAG